MVSTDLKFSISLINNSAQSIDENINFLTVSDAFRYLRNECGSNQDFQNEIVRDGIILQSAKTILLKIVSDRNLDQNATTCLQVGLQFLANLLVNNKHNQELVWLSCMNFLIDCLKFNNEKVNNYSAMILYNIFHGKPELVNELAHPLEELICLTKKETTSEFSLFVLELFVLKSDYVDRFYASLKPESKLIILEVIQSLITEQHNPNIKSEVIKYYVNYFNQKSDCILKIFGKEIDSVDPIEIVRVLDVLIAFSSDDQKIYLKIIQEEPSLLINCAMLLKSIHSLSKQMGNAFTMLNKLSDFNNLENGTSLEENPEFGFKCSLIRLIGNLCWKNLPNQNKVRELECIQIILDCCNIDARNPFITQWCILAIRNICEKNYENQGILKALSMEGKIDTLRLQEIGITLNCDSNGDVLCIASLNKAKES